MFRSTILLSTIYAIAPLHASEEQTTFSISCIEPNFEGNKLEYQAAIPADKVSNPQVIKSIIYGARYWYILEFLKSNQKMEIFEYVVPRIGNCTIHVYGFSRKTCGVIPVECITQEMLTTNTHGIEAQIFREENRY